MNSDSQTEAPDANPMLRQFVQRFAESNLQSVNRMLGQVLDRASNPSAALGKSSAGPANPAFFRVFRDLDTNLEQVMRNVDEIPGKVAVFHSNSFEECLERVNSHVPSRFCRERKEESVSEFFSTLLALPSPWRVTAVTISKSERRLNLRIDFPLRSLFSCPVCNQKLPAKEATEKSWDHSGVWNYSAIITGLQPVVECPRDGRQTPTIPWNVSTAHPSQQP